MDKKITLVDLFAGCGGLSDGFEQTHLYQTLACVEWEKAPCETLANRLHKKWSITSAKDIVLHFDIQRTEELINGWSNDPIYGSSKGLQAIVGKGKVDVVIGGPPCQAYSLAGRIRDENGMNDDYRNFLFESYLGIVDHFKPKAFIFENVPGMLSATPGGVSIVERITESFSAKGYEITNDLRGNALIDCTKFGVPQARKRMVILGLKRDEIEENPQIALHDFYNFIFPKYQSKKAVTVKDAIGDLPKLYPLKEQVRINQRKLSHSCEDISIANHQPRLHSKRDIDTFTLLTNDIESGQNQYSSIESLKDLYFELTGKRSNIHKYHVLKWNKPSNTIPAHLYKDGLRHIHPDPKQARSITVREAGRLQSFDDDFEFLGSLTDQYKMVGNAVPPKFAKAIGLALKDFLIKYF